MPPSGVKLRSSHRLRGWVLALALATLGVAACGGDDGGESESATTAAADSNISTDAGQAGEEIVIKTQVKINAAEENVGSNVSRGAILDGSSIGDSPFCPDGTFQDAHSDDPAIGFVDRTIQCPDGGLRIGFSPGPPPTPLTQSGPWHVVSGTGAFKGMQGDGQMEIAYEPHTEATEGRETFTGTVEH
jgi:hypothetical protein